jgi:hypothetical protein
MPMRNRTITKRDIARNLYALGPRYVKPRAAWNDYVPRPSSPTGRKSDRPASFGTDQVRAGRQRQDHIMLLANIEFIINPPMQPRDLSFDRCQPLFDSAHSITEAVEPSVHVRPQIFQALNKERRELFNRIDFFLALRSLRWPNLSTAGT